MMTELRAKRRIGENYDASGNTLYLSSNTWYEDSSFDVLVRPVVSSLSGVDALPVELVAFGAQVTGRSATLEWQTASETGNAWFDVQRRRREDGWTTVGQVDGAGTTTKPQRYKYRVSDLSYGTHRFRLRQVDVDGTTHHSRELKAVVTPSQGISVKAYPNPVSTEGTVRVAANEERELSVEVYDLLGRKVAHLFDGRVTPKQPEILNLNSSSLSSGTYFLRVHGEGTTRTSRITVVR